ncbi:MAG: flagellar basal body protein [Pseudomonadota bacterium]
MLSTAFDIAQSGLAAEARRVQVAANNIANASTEGYVPQRVEQTTAGDSSGVRVAVRPIANDSLYAADVGVDLLQETTTLLHANAAYHANLAVIETVGEMFDSLLEAVDHDRDRRDD